MGEWNDDMSQAPKDETEVLIYDKRMGVNQAVWCRYRKVFVECVEGYMAFLDATHWMPLPEPPQEEPKQ